MSKKLVKSSRAKKKEALPNNLKKKKLCPITLPIREFTTLLSSWLNDLIEDEFYISTSIDELETSVLVIVYTTEKGLTTLLKKPVQVLSDQTNETGLKKYLTIETDYKEILGQNCPDINKEVFILFLEKTTRLKGIPLCSRFSNYTGQSRT